MLSPQQVFIYNKGLAWLRLEGVTHLFSIEFRKPTLFQATCPLMPGGKD